MGKQESSIFSQRLKKFKDRKSNSQTTKGTNAKLQQLALDKEWNKSNQKLETSEKLKSRRYSIANPYRQNQQKDSTRKASRKSRTVARKKAETDRIRAEQKRQLTASRSASTPLLA